MWKKVFTRLLLKQLHFSDYYIDHEKPRLKIIFYRDFVNILLRNSKKFFIFLFLLIICISNFPIFAQTNQTNVTARYDATGPDLVVLSNVPIYVNGSVILTWTAASAAASYNVEVATDTNFTNIIQTIPTVALTTLVSGLPDSVIFFRVTPVSSFNQAGFMSNVVSTISDITTPISAVTTSTQSGNNIVITYTALDNLSGIQNVYLYYRYNGGAWINNGSMTGSPSTFTPGNGDGIYAFVSIAVDNANNIEVKSFIPESTVNFITIVVTPTLTPTPTPTPTISPTTPIITITPTPDQGVLINLEILTLPHARINIYSNGILLPVIFADQDGLFKGQVRVSDINNIKIVIQNNKDTIMFSQNFSGQTEIRFITSPIFDGYYFLVGKSDTMEIKGQATPFATIIFYNLGSESIVVNTDSAGYFGVKIRTNDIKHNTVFYAIASLNSLKSLPSKDVLIVVLNTSPTISDNLGDFWSTTLNESLIQRSALAENAKMNISDILGAVGFIFFSLTLGVWTFALFRYGPGIFIFRKRYYGRVMNEHASETVFLAIVWLLNGKKGVKRLTDAKGYFWSKNPLDSLDSIIVLKNNFHPKEIYSKEINELTERHRILPILISPKDGLKIGNTVIEEIVKFFLKIFKDLLGVVFIVYIAFFLLTYNVIILGASLFYFALILIKILNQHEKI